MKQEATLVCVPYLIGKDEQSFLLLTRENQVLQAFAHSYDEKILTPVKYYLICDGKFDEGQYFYRAGKVHLCKRIDKGKIYSITSRDKSDFFEDDGENKKVVAMPSEINLTVKIANRILAQNGKCFIEVENDSNPMGENAPSEAKEEAGLSSALRNRFWKKYQVELSCTPKMKNGKVIISLV